MFTHSVIKLSDNAQLTSTARFAIGWYYRVRKWAKLSLLGDHRQPLRLFSNGPESQGDRILAEYWFWHQRQWRH